MDLFEQISEDRQDKALDRLETMLALYEAESEIEQDLALERATAYCEREWGSYAAGLDGLATRTEARGAGAVETAMTSLRLREEGDTPGSIIQAMRQQRRRERGLLGEREAVIALYGGEEAVASPTPFETIFIAACASLAEEGAQTDPFAPLAGWQLPWHPLPDTLAVAVTTAFPLPGTVVAARAECLKWEERLRHLELLFQCPGSGTLPTACAARRKLVEDLWRRDVNAASLDDFSARLDYWAERGGDDGGGYAVLLRDFAAMAHGLSAKSSRESTKDRARRLKSEHPEWSLATIGKQLGISRQAVHKHLKGFNTAV
ncbi:hypothetical protein CU669_07925 [Paramagnetospirillum kuznetsovii]|uniref:Uncharacterized protein n=1 Tax=Paramagnetospirillum kuznetsovii TaxID=2053833 RepID=A0A364P029_9PROT|nr:HTH domain-containing protein [Paramagnetospirillum kuznetsovii]RAU22600.1 hypothetical protein CU669_07925 [Paramagnetospirillum kuznetsovii]